LFLQGLYIAPVAKSTAKGNKPNAALPINAAGLILRDDCPGPGFILWQSETLPPNKVPQLSIIVIRKMNKNLLIANMILGAVCIVTSVAAGNWGAAMGWGVALLWEFMYFKNLED